MSMQYYSVHPPTAVQNAMAGTHFHTPQSIFQPTMTNQGTSQQDGTQWLKMSQMGPLTMSRSSLTFPQPNLDTIDEMPPDFFKRQGHHKRKLETLDIVNIRPAKQLITEEKMAQHFRGLYISNNAPKAQEPKPSTSTATIIKQSSDINLSFPNSLEKNETNLQPRLVLSEELKRLQEEPILPSSLLSKLERPTMALVLWEPPSKHLRILPTRDTPTPIPSNHSNNNGMEASSENNNENNGNNNNNESIPNLNQTMDVNIADPDLEPMDL